MIDNPPETQAHVSNLPFMILLWDGVLWGVHVIVVTYGVLCLLTQRDLLFSRPFLTYRRSGNGAIAYEQNLVDLYTEFCVAGRHEVVNL